MDALINDMSAMRIAGGLVQAQKIVLHDVDIILECYGRDFPSIFGSNVRIWADMLIEDPDLRLHFFNHFYDESVLYQYMHAIITQRLPASHHIEVMPLIDEYIEIVMHMRS